MKAVTVQHASAALSALEMVNGLFWAESKTEWEDGTRLVSVLQQETDQCQANCFCQSGSHTPFGKH